MGIGKLSTFRRKPVDVGSFELGGSVATKIAVTEIVGEDENDIGRSVFCRRQKRKGQGRQGQDGREVFQFEREILMRGVAWFLRRKSESEVFRIHAMTSN